MDLMKANPGRYVQAQDELLKMYDVWNSRCFIWKDASLYLETDFFALK